ncbi:hypothetical protein [Streptomyces sp. SGAir0957]
MATSSVVRIEGDVGGQVIVGDHNVVIGGPYGSSAALRSEGPPPVRRREDFAGLALPQRPAVLLGRESELAAVDEWLGDGHVVQVYGPPGIGKSAVLRRHAVNQAALGRGLVLLSAAGLTVEDVIQDLFHACFETEDYKPEPARMRRLMGTVQALLVVDDFAGSPQDLAALANAAPGCDLLVAAVDRCASDEVRTLRLGGLPETAALGLVEREVRRDLEEAECAAVRALVGTVGGHPLTLVQRSAAVRAAETAGAGPAGGAFTAGESELAVGLASSLDDTGVRVLRVLAALSPLTVSTELLHVLAGGVDPTAGTRVTEELRGSRVIERDGPGYRGRGDLTAAVVRQTGGEGEAGEFAAALTDWLRSGVSRKQAAAEAAVICGVLSDAARREDHAGVLDLARGAAPVLAGTLRWGSWRTVLEHGRVAAAALGATADAAYFAHEEAVRRKTLGVAAAITAVTVGGGVGVGGAAVHNAVASGGKSAAALGKAGLGSIATKPVVVATAVAALVSGGVFVALADTGDDAPAATGPGASPVASVPSTHFTPPPLPSPSSKPPGHKAGPSSPSESPPTSGARVPPTDGSQGCVPIPITAPDFGRTTQHKKVTRQVDFHAWLPCDDEKSLKVNDEDNWTVARTACPSRPDPRLCRFTVTFDPGAPGTYHATVTIRDDWGHDDLWMNVTGVADPTPSTPAAPTPSPPPSEPTSPTPLTPTPRQGPTEPLPATT